MNLPIKKQIDYALGLASGQDDPHSITITELCASLSHLHAELDEARDHAYGWHNQCQTVATILGLPEPEGIGHAEAVRDRFEAIRAENERLTASRDEYATQCADRAREADRWKARAQAAEAREAKAVGILQNLDPENAIDDSLLRDIHCRLQLHGEKYPDRAVSVLHRNVVFYTIQAALRALAAGGSDA